MQNPFMKPIHKFYCLSGLLTLSVSSTFAADEPDDADGRQCINASTIRHTKIIDDSSILFYVRGNSIYRNILSRQCSGLLREGRFSYRRTSASLCRRDFIQVLYSSGGGMREGPSCALGNFYAMTEEEVELLLDPPPQTPQPVPLPPADPEEVIENPDET